MGIKKHGGAVSFLRHASDIARFYGFRPVQTIEDEFADRSAPRRKTSLYTFPAAAVVCSIRTATPEPILAFYATPAPTYTPTHLPEREIGEFGLTVMGTPESVGEIVLIKTTAAIVSEWGLPVSRVRLNALGDRDSQSRFLREIHMHVRRHAAKFEGNCQQENLRDPLTLYRCSAPVCQAVAQEAPRSVQFLSEKSRAHFRSVIEQVEQLGLPYELDDTLVGDARSPHLTFAVDFKDTDTTVQGALGGRFDEYLRRETRRRDSSGVGASIFFRKKGASQQKFFPPKITPKPRVYFAQLGLKAKLQGLTVIDMLRSARVPVLHSFNTSQLSGQLSLAREQGVSHLFIMGQREAIDGTVIVRTMKNSSQTTVPLTELPKVLRSLK